MRFNVKKLVGRELKIPETIINRVKFPICQDFFPINDTPNIFLCARKNSGKTTTIYNIVDRIIRDYGTKCKFIIFASTLNKDSVWQAILRLLKSKNVPYFAETSHISTSPDGTKVNQLQRYNDLLTGLEIDEAPKMLTVLIFDDNSQDMRDKNVEVILKKNRHLNMCTIISSQQLTDLKPGAITQLDYILMYSGISKDRVKEIAKKMELYIDAEDMWQLYKLATSKPYSFLWVQKNPERYRINFNCEVDLKQGKEYIDPEE